MSSTLKSTLNRVSALLGVALIVATAVVFATASGGENAAAKPDVAVAAVDRVDIKDFKFAPVAITVPAGTTITWTNSDKASHTATSGTSPIPDRLFDTDIITTGESKTIKTSERGTFEYYCALHPFMQATVTVR